MRPQALELVRDHQRAGDTRGHRHRHQRIRHRARSPRAFGVEELIAVRAGARRRRLDHRRDRRRALACARARSRAWTQWLAARGLDWDRRGDHLLFRFHQRPAAAGAVDHPVATNPDDAPARPRRSSAAGAYSTCSHETMIKKFIDKLLGTAGARPQAASSASARKSARRSTASTRRWWTSARSTWCTRSRRPASRPTSWAAPCATCCWACGPRTSTWPPTPRPSRSRACSAAPSSSAGAFASCTWCTGAGASTR